MTHYRKDKDGVQWEWMHGRDCWIPSDGPPAPPTPQPRLAEAESPTLSYEDWIREYRYKREIVMPISEYSAWK